jgi:hypothetical protein
MTALKKAFTPKSPSHEIFIILKFLYLHVLVVTSAFCSAINNCLGYFTFFKKAGQGIFGIWGRIGMVFYPKDRIATK